MYLFDYHMHSNKSIDAHDTLIDLCKKALKTGLKEIAITDHFEPTKSNPNFTSYNALESLSEVLEVRRIFGKDLKIKFGIELGQPHIYSKASESVIKENPFDYVLASAHKMADDVDFGELDYSKIDINYYCMKYLNELKNLSKWNLFDCIAHLDLVKRYAARCGVKIQLINYKDQLEEILQTLIHNGKGIEINTSGLRQHSKTCLPDLDIVKFYRELGGEILTFGSDAHYAEHVGNGIKEASEIAQAAGFNYITTFNDRRPSWIKISTSNSLYYFENQVKLA